MHSGIIVYSKDAFNTSGNILNNGNFNLSGNYTSTGTTGGDGFYRLGGNWTNTGGFFLPGLSTVIFNGLSNQSLTRAGGETFYNLSIMNTGADPSNNVIISNNVGVSGTLSMSTGNVDAAAFILFLNNPLTISLDYSSTTRSRVIGKFEREIGETKNYLFPIGTSSHFAPANLQPNNILSPGSIVSEFFTLPAPGNAGLPVPDPPVEIASTFPDGFWSLNSNGFSTDDYNINLNGAEFTDTVTSVTRILIRTSGGDWIIDGMHHIADTVKSVVFRDNLIKNILPAGTQFALGRAHPLITRQPRDTIVCEDTDPVFTIAATGAPALKYTWYKVPGVLIQNGAHYSGARTPSLTIISAQLADAGDYYCIVTDRFRNSSRTHDANLIVNKIPVASATPGAQDHECTNIPFTDILFGETYGVPGSTYVWTRDNPAGIVSALPMNGTINNIGDVLPGMFANTTDKWLVVTFKIIPVGPAPTYCQGIPIYATVTVNPVPEIIPLNNRPSICYGGTTEIILTTSTEMTTGSIRFDYTVTKTGGTLTVGSTADATNLVPDHNINFPYQNNSNTIQSIHYFITPKVDNAVCPPGLTVESEVKVHAKPLQDLVITHPLTCTGLGGLASIRADLSEGAGPYQIVWDGVMGYHSEGSAEISNLITPGKYIAKITDNLLCYYEDFTTVSSFLATPFISVRNKPGGFNTTCIGSTDGEMIVSATGGITFPYRYWVIKNDIDTVASGVFSNNYSGSDPTTFKEIKNLGAGRYTLKLKDINDCEPNPGKATVKDPTPITVIFKKFQYDGGYNISCKGYNDGSVWIEPPAGGRGGYTYRWYTFNGTIPGPVNTNRLDNISAGKYYLETKDVSPCVKIDSVVITEPDGMQLTGSQLSASPDGNYNISCNGGNDGSINMTVSGGSGNYLFTWNGPDGYGATTKDISGLKAGLYTCTVRDLNGCILMPIPTFNLTQPAVLDFSVVTSVSADGAYEINCNGGKGSIDITPSGGSIGNYTYTWSKVDGVVANPSQEDQPLLKAGTYHLIVKDLNNCVAAKDITLDEPPVFSIQLMPVHITCASPGFNNGSVDLSVNGGVAPYSYSWSNGRTTEDISDLTEGYYRVKVTYNNTCSVKDSVRVNLPPNLTSSKALSSFNNFNISCFGQSDGTITVNPITGKAPFTYQWSSLSGFNSTAKDLSGLRAGEYQILITDSNLCTETDTVILTEPGKLGMTFNLSSSISGGFNINCAGDTTGMINVEPFNHVNNVEYIWSDGVSGKIRENLPAGDYSVIITDSNNCQAGSSVTVTEPDSIKIDFNVHKPFCPDMKDGEIHLTVAGGVRGTDYTYAWTGNQTGNNITDILRGEYKVVVSDLNGCIAKDSVKVEPINSTCLIIPNIISPNGDLINDVWNIGMTELYPNMEIRIFNRWGETIWRSDKGYTKPWDGKSNGSDLPIDSYHYIIDLKNGTKPVLGNITIVR